MKESDDLFSLIKSLSPSEKRYFKIFASQSNKKEENNYVLLFDIIDRFNDHNYNEDILKYRLRKHSFVKQLHVTKNYLYNLILRSLRNYYGDSSVESKLQEFLKSSDILYKKNLHQQSYKTLLKAEKYALENEKYLYLLEIYAHIEKQLVHLFVNTNEITSVLSEMEYKRREIQKYIFNSNEYTNLWNKLYSLVKNTDLQLRYDDTKVQLNEIISNPLLSNIDKALTFHSKRYFYMIYSIYYMFAVDMKKIYEYNKAFLGLYTIFPNRIEDDLRYYIAALCNFNLYCIYLNKDDEWQDSLDKLKHILITYNHVVGDKRKLDIKAWCLRLEMTYYSLRKKYKENEKLIAKNESLIQEINLLQNKEHPICITYFVAYHSFIMGDLKKSLQMVNEIINVYHEDSHPQIQSLARMLKLILYFELGHFDMLSYIIKSNYRFLRKKKRLCAIENVILNSLLSLPNITSKTEMTHFFVLLKENLLPLTLDIYEQRLFDLLDLISWADSKINNISFEKALEAAGPYYQIYT